MSHLYRRGRRKSASSLAWTHQLYRLTRKPRRRSFTWRWRARSWSETFIFLACGRGNGISAWQSRRSQYENPQSPAVPDCAWFRRQGGFESGRVSDSLDIGCIHRRSTSNLCLERLAFYYPRRVFCAFCPVAAPAPSRVVAEIWACCFAPGVDPGWNCGGAGAWAGATGGAGGGARGATAGIGGGTPVAAPPPEGVKIREMKPITIS